jgi:methionyl-tRNA formyltransferase
VRLAYLGSPEAAVPPLRALVDGGHDIAMVITQPDRRRGRGATLLPTPVKAAAAELGLPVTHRVKDLLDTDVERGVVVAFGRLLRPEILAAVPMVNMHFSLLPRWRGAAPVERAILAGDAETGVCLMEIDEGLDTGPVYACETVAIEPDDTTTALRERLVAVGTRLLVDQLAAGLGAAAPQSGEATYAEKIEPDDVRLDWNRPAIELHRVVRVEGAWTTFRGKRFKLHRVRLRGDVTALAPGEIDGVLVGCGDGKALELVEVQPEGRGRQPADTWRNGARLQPGERLGDPLGDG